MFNGSRFFSLLRTWKNEEKNDYIRILRTVMNHYFDSISGKQMADKLTIRGAFSVPDIAYVLDRVGYHGYSINTSEPGVAYVTLRNSL